AAEREDGEPPATITILGGDVHAAYVAEVALGTSQRSRIHQIVCSPFRNPLLPRERRFWSAGCNRALGAAMRVLARAACVRPTAASWRFLSGPTFDNSIAQVGLDEPAATVTDTQTVGE